MRKSTHAARCGGRDHDFVARFEYVEGEAILLQLTPELEGESVVLTCYDGAARLQDGLHFEVPAEV